MNVELIIHLEADGAEAVWWAESPDVAGFSAAAPTLAELRQMAVEGIEKVRGTDVTLVETMTPFGDDAHDGLVARVQLLPA